MDKKNNNKDNNNTTLVEHLEAICDANHVYKSLISAWQQNEDKIPAALKTIGVNFPHYSEHDFSHSNKLIQNIERLLGHDRIERLGATDTFLILMAALTHDIGMCFSYDTLKKEWEKPEMEDRLKKYAKESDPQIKHASTLLLNYRCRQDDRDKGFAWALELRNAVTLITAQMMRGGHAKRSKEYIEDDEGWFAMLANHFYINGFSKRYKKLLADVAQLHGEGFDEVMKLHAEEDGVGNDTVHPRFIACMIRLGDLLDMDSDRFNAFSLATIEEMPESSKAHYDKHLSLEHQKISPNGIEFTMNCKTDASYRVACDLEKMLKEEVEKQHLHWSSIAPDDLGGNPPVIHQNSLKILFNGKETRPELRNLRFDISGQRTFEMLKGGAIYQNPGRVFIREIVQNALDATKLQIWKNIDNHMPFKLNNPDRKIETVDDIKFSSDIPAWVYEKYPIRLNVAYEEEKQVVRVVCEDWGTGISEESLIRMTSQVGASRKADKNYNETIKQMPYFLQPTAAFGLGLQTVFYVTDEFTVETHYPGEHTRKIVFRSSVEGSYCSEIENIIFERKGKPVEHGTTVTIEIGKEHFEELFEISKERVEDLEKVSGDYSYYIAEKIDSYVNACFSDMEFIPIEYKSPFLTQKLGSNDEHRGLEFIKVEDQFPEKEHFRLYRLIGTEECHFYIEEKKYGSILEVVFWGNRSSGLSLRGVKVNDFINYIGNQRSMGIKWHLFNREADQLVTLSRDELLQKGKEWCENTLNQLITDIIKLTYENMHKECLKGYSSNEKKQKFQEQYFNFCMVNWCLPVPLNIDYKPLSEYVLHEKGKNSSGRKCCVIDNRGEGIKASDFFKASKIAVRIPGRSTSTYESWESVSIKVLKLLNEKMLVWRSPHIPISFRCVAVYNVYLNDDNGKKSIVNGFQLVKSDGDSNHFVKIIGDNVPLNSEGLRYGFERYKKIVVGEEAPLLGFGKLDYADCWIYPYGPITEKDLKLGRDKLYEKLKGEHIKDLVPKYIVNLVQKYNVLKNEMLTADEIYDEYRRLILDSQFGIKKGE
jgi:hypothetical protein